MIKALIIDDEASIRAWISTCLERIENVTVMGCAADGDEGLELFIQDQPDVVFVDIFMPKCDGIKTICEMKKISDRFYSVFLTSHKNVVYARNRIYQNIDEYILKTEINEAYLRIVLENTKRKLENSAQCLAIERTNERNTFLRSLISEREEWISSQDINNLGINFDNNYLIAITCGLTRKAVSNWYIENFLLDRCINICDLIVFDIDFEKKMIIASVVNKKISSSRQKSNYALKLGEVIVDEFGFNVGISDIINDKDRLVDCMRKSLSRFKQIFYFPNKNIIFSEEGNCEQIREDSPLITAFQYAIEKRDFKQIVVIKNKIVKRVQQWHPSNIRQVKSLFFTLATYIIHESNIVNDEIAQKTLLIREDFFSTKSFYELVTKFDFLLKMYKPILKHRYNFKELQ